MRSHLTRFLTLATCVAPCAAQGRLELAPCSGGIGKSINYEVRGGTAFRPFFFFTSQQRGTFPLAAVDSRDTRSLGVGLDLLGLLLLLQFDNSGEATFSLPLPNDAALAGQSLVHQALGFPGTTLTFAGLSEVRVVPLEVPGAWRQYLQFAMRDKRAWNSVIPVGNDRFLMAGGGNGALLALQAVASTDFYDPATRRFSNGPDMTQARGIHITAKLPDGKYLLAGGVDHLNDPQKTCDFYDPAANRFTAASPMSTPRMLHTGTVLRDGRVLVAGGLTSLNGNVLQQIQSVTDRTEIYDPRTNAWSNGPNLSEKRAGHTAHLLADGRVVLIGGITLGFLNLPFFSPRVDVYDPTTNRITRLAGSLSAARAGQASALLPNGKLLVAGGVGGSVLPNGGTALSSCELYDFARNSWSGTASLPGSPRGVAGYKIAADGKFVITGGVRGSLTNPNAVGDCAVFDPATSRWTALPALTTSRATHVLLELESCALIVVGGGSGQTGSALATQELLYR